MNQLYLDWLSSDDGKRSAELDLELSLIKQTISLIYEGLSKDNEKVYRICDKTGKVIEKIIRYETDDLLSLRKLCVDIGYEKSQCIKSLTEARRVKYLKTGDY